MLNVIKLSLNLDIKKNMRGVLCKSFSSHNIGLRMSEYSKSTLPIQSEQNQPSQASPDVKPENATQEKDFDNTNSPEKTSESSIALVCYLKKTTDTESVGPHGRTMWDTQAIFAICSCVCAPAAALTPTALAAPPTCTVILTVSPAASLRHVDTLAENWLAASILAAGLY